MPTIESVTNIQLEVADAEARRRVRPVLGRPSHAESREEGGRDPQGLATGAGCSALGVVGSSRANERQESEELPAHPALPIDEHIRTRDDAGDAGGPHETF